MMNRKIMTNRKTILFMTLTLGVMGQHLCPIHAQESASPPTPSANGLVADITKLPRLAVTTAGIANSIIRTRDPQDRESLVNRTYVQNYTSSLAVSADGFLYANTTWEEGHRPAEMIARKRTKADEYLLFYPMYVGNATTMVRWRPSPLAALSVPEGFERKEDQLVWQPVAGAAGYRIERKVLGPDGWTGWSAAGETKETRWHDAAMPSGKGHARRVRALGPVESDWTHTITKRGKPKTH